MTRADDIDAAVDAGILDAGRADRLKTFFADRSSAATPAENAAYEDTEFVRFARGFHDVFLTIGVVLLVSGVALTGQLVSEPIGAFAAAGTAWALAEVFTARRKLVLPSIALAIAFVFLVGLGLNTLETSAARLRDLNLLSTGSAVAALVAAIVFYVRFRLPFAAGIIAVAAVGLLQIAVTILAPDAAETLFIVLLLGCGIATLVAAMAFDVTDRERTTLRADTAFWLHLVAAPLIVHALIALVASSDVGKLEPSGAISIIAVVAVLALFALIIDRRALLVAGLIYLGIAIGRIVSEVPLEAGTVVAVTVLLLGIGLVLLGTGWQAARRAVVGNVVPDGIARRLPPLTARPA